MDGGISVRRPVLLGVAILLLVGAAIAAGGAWYLYRMQTSGGPPPGLQGLQVFGEIPDFSLTERDGRTIGRANLAAKVWVANFIYTTCTDTCPLQTAQMARLHKEFEAEAGLVFVSITVDPRRDTPQALRTYAAKYGADPARWWFLTGKKEPIYALIQDGFHLSVEDPTDSGQPRVRPVNTTRSEVQGSERDAQRSTFNTQRDLALGAPVSALDARRSALDSWLVARGSWLASLGSRLWALGSPTAAWAHSDHEFLAPAFLHSSWFVLGDRKARIRGYYKSHLEEDLSRLRGDVRTLLADRSS
jgi:cytochrome oxidase Cu insertion factor (SCO1/SenC/PrrC family)